MYMSICSHECRTASVHRRQKSVSDSMIRGKERVRKLHMVASHHVGAGGRTQVPQSIKYSNPQSYLSSPNDAWCLLGHPNLRIQNESIIISEIPVCLLAIKCPVCKRQLNKTFYTQNRFLYVSLLIFTTNVECSLQSHFNDGETKMQRN